jgi:predicted alpha/beta-hydrolase family hydrolase
MPAELLWNEPESPTATLVLAHGSGNNSRSPWMTEMAALIAGHGIRVGLFDFEYAAGPTRKPPSRGERLADEYRAVLGQIEGPVFIGGKSLGGRVASLIADEVRAAGLVCLGYPFHPPGAPGKLRTGHLAHIATRTLICQGERDPFGTRDDLAGYELSPAITVFWVPDGDHSLRPRVASGRTERQNLEAAAAAVWALVASARPPVE